MGELIDFDAFRREREAVEGESKPNVFKIGGKEYPYPAEVPAELVMDILRLQRDMGEGATVPAHVLVTIGESVFGAEAFTTILRENQVAATELGDLILMVIRSWGIVDDEVPNPTPPEGALTS